MVHLCHAATHFSFRLVHPVDKSFSILGVLVSRSVVDRNDELR